MARVNLDGKVWKDPRVKRLARRRSWSLRETIGTLAAVWDVAYDNKTPIMPRVDVDTAAETDNFASDMVAEDLATEITDSLVSVRLRGVTDRIQYLLSQAERGRAGGLARAKGAQRGPDGRVEANAKQAPGERQANAKQAPDLPPDQDLALPLPLPPDQDLAPARRERAPRRRGGASPSVPMSDEWAPDAAGQARAGELGLDCEQLARKFRGYYIAHGQLKPASAWDQLFCSWLERERPDGRATRRRPARARDEAGTLPEWAVTVDKPDGEP